MLSGSSSAGPITGVSTINSRLPSAAILPPQMAPPMQGYGSGLQPPGMPGLPQMTPPGMGAADDDDDDDDPQAKRPRLDDGSLVPEQKWIERYPSPINIMIQVNLGTDVAAANLPSAIPLEMPVRTMVIAMKQLLVSKVQSAGMSIASIKLKITQTGYILKNTKTLAFYNVAPGTVIELTRKQRGGK